MRGAVYGGLSICDDCHGNLLYIIENNRKSREIIENDRKSLKIVEDLLVIMEIIKSIGIF